MRYASFVIRLWKIETDESAADSGFRGRIEHVQSGDVGFVKQFGQMTTFIKEHTIMSRPSTEDRGKGRQSCTT